MLTPNIYHPPQELSLLFKFYKQHMPRISILSSAPVRSTVRSMNQALEYCTSCVQTDQQILIFNPNPQHFTPRTQYVWPFNHDTKGKQQ
jgi:hypothetical protein